MTLRKRQREPYHWASWGQPEDFTNLVRNGLLASELYCPALGLFQGWGGTDRSTPQVNLSGV
jgi:hypothetical protein